VLRLAIARPVVPVAAAGVIAVAAVLVVLVHPALTPILLGYTLFALHVVCAALRKRPAGHSVPGVPLERSSGTMSVSGAASPR
jgi:hypothetical protein